MKTFARAVLIAITALVAIILYVPAGSVDYTSAWRAGTYGVTLDASRVSTTIREVAPDSPAARAGIRVGDTLDVGSFSKAYPRFAFPFAGKTRTFALHRGARAYSVTMTAQPSRGFDGVQKALGVIALLPATIFLAVAFALVFLRPNVMTWSFYAFAAGYISTSPSFGYFAEYLPVGAYMVLAFALSTVFGNFAVLPLLPFVLRFPDDRLTGFSRRFDRAVWIAIAVAFVAYAYQWYSWWGLGRQPWIENALDVWLPLVTFFVAALILIRKYKTATPQVRQRFGFLTIGLLVSFMAYAVYYVPGVPSAFAQVAGGLVVIMPVCVIYAVLKHRVIDVNFVINRAIAYSALSLVVIAFVSLLDWSAGHVISEGRFATGLELLLTIAVGFLLDRINRVTERAVESVFFRKRRDAEQYLRRTARVLPYATEEAAITEGLVEVPAYALDLSAAALYRRSEDESRFDGVATSANTTVAPPGFERNHLLVRLLQSSEEPVWLEQIRAHLEAENAGIYVLAIPVTVRHELVSFVLYGAHRNGSQIDPEEVELLEELAREASQAYDHIEAVRMRERLAALGAAR